MGRHAGYADGYGAVSRFSGPLRSGTGIRFSDDGRTESESD